jgi:hypothetical protein
VQECVTGGTSENMPDSNHQKSFSKAVHDGQFGQRGLFRLERRSLSGRWRFGMASALITERWPLITILEIKAATKSESISNKKDLNPLQDKHQSSILQRENWWHQCV